MACYAPEADGDMSGWLICLNEIIVFLKLPKYHLVQLGAVLKKLKEAGLKLKPVSVTF